MTEARAELNAPAKTIEELAERIFDLAGRMLKLRIEPTAAMEGYTEMGVFNRGVLTDGRSYVSAYLGASAVIDQRCAVTLSSTVSVLTDGKWVPVHTPEGKSR